MKKPTPSAERENKELSEIVWNVYQEGIKSGYLAATLSKAEFKKQDKNAQEVKQPALTALVTMQNEAVIDAVDKKLATLAEAVPLLDLCEKDSDRILIWVKNHRWSLIAPKGKDTQAPPPKLKPKEG